MRHISLRIFALLITAVGFVLTAVSCGDDDASVDEPTITFRVVQEGSGRVEEVTREEELPRSEAESEAEQEIGFEIAIPPAIGELVPVQVEVWENPNAPLLLVQRGVRASFSAESDSSAVVMELDIGHPISGPLQQDDEEAIDMPGIGIVLIGKDAQSMDASYLWLIGEVRYRLAYVEGAVPARRDDVLVAIQELAEPP